MDRLSVILPNYEHFDITIAHVREVLNSELRPYEVVIVNDGGDPKLKDMIKDLIEPMKPLASKVIYAQILPPKIPWNYNGAVNLGVWLSTGDYLVIEDNDNIPTKDLYGKMINVMMSHPNVGRVYSFKRMEIERKDVGKTSSEWKPIGGRGPNQGSYMIRRDVYLKLKGQDERMCGRYGWMYYDWKNRMLGKAKIEFAQAGNYWYVVDGQTSLKRGNAPENYRIYRQNAKSTDMHHEHGILNFKFETERL